MQVEFRDVRYLIALSMVLLSSKYHTKSTLRNLIIAISILYLAYGPTHLLLISAVVSANVILILLRVCNEYAFFLVNLFFLYSYKYHGKTLEPQIGGAYDISGFLMILIVKMCYLGRDYNNRIEDAINYILYVPSMLVGPATSYVEFVNQMCPGKYSKPSGSTSLVPNYRQPSNINNHRKFIMSKGLQSRKPSRNIGASKLQLRQLSISILFLLIHAILKSNPFLQTIKSEMVPWYKKIMCLYLYNISMRAKYHFAWRFSHTCMCLTNVADHLNIDFVKVEFAESVKEISANWNKFMSKFLKEFVFLKLVKRSKTFAANACFIVSAFIHSYKPSYLLFFISFGFFSKIICRANEHIPYRMLRVAQTCLFVNYFSLPFYTGSIDDTKEIWKSLYYFGHIYILMLFLYQMAEDTYKMCHLYRSIKSSKIENKHCSITK